jgi:streptomycin 6-kinase
MTPMSGDSRASVDIAPWDGSIPESFTKGVITEAGAGGIDWLAELPHLVGQLCSDWGLLPENRPMHGYLGLVIPVRHGDSRCVLKVTYGSDDVLRESIALSTWHGEGAVRLIRSDVDRGALLLERLNSDRTLAVAPIDEAVSVAARLLRRLAVPAPDGLPTTAERVDEWATTWPARWERLGRPVPRALLDDALGAAQQWRTRSGRLLIDDDLHYGNVLAGQREPWLVIDPKVVVGDPEYGVAPLLWRRFDEPDGLADRFRMIVDGAALDPERARAWTLARTVDYWLWAVGAGLTHDPVMCRTVAEWLTT